MVMKMYHKWPLLMTFVCALICRKKTTHLGILYQDIALFISIFVKKTTPQSSLPPSLSPSLSHTHSLTHSISPFLISCAVGGGGGGGVGVGGVGGGGGGGGQLSFSGFDWHQTMMIVRVRIVGWRASNVSHGLGCIDACAAASRDGSQWQMDVPVHQDEHAENPGLGQPFVIGLPEVQGNHSDTLQAASRQCARHGLSWCVEPSLCHFPRGWPETLKCECFCLILSILFLSLSLFLPLRRNPCTSGWTTATRRRGGSIMCCWAPWAWASQCWRSRSLRDRLSEAADVCGLFLYCRLQGAGLC